MEILSNTAKECHNNSAGQDGVFESDLHIIEISEIDNDCIIFKTDDNTSCCISKSKNYKTIRHECFYEIYSNSLRYINCTAEISESVGRLEDSDFVRFIVQNPERWETEEI